MPASAALGCASYGARTMCWRFFSQSSSLSPGAHVILLSIQYVVLWCLVPQYLVGKGVVPEWGKVFLPVKNVTQQQIVRAPRQLCRDNLPYDIQIDAEVVVDQPIQIRLFLLLHVSYLGLRIS